MKKDRPLGITILAVIYIILGLLSLVWSGLVLGIGGVTAAFTSLFGTEIVGSSTALTGLLGVVAAIVQLVVAFGLFGLKKWAWYLALIGVGLTLVQGVLGLFSGGIATFICGGIGLIIPLVIFIYLMSVRVREVFEIS